MSTFPSNDNASGIWTLKKQKRAVQAEAWPPGPFRSDNTYSVYFDGTTDYLNVSDSSINLGTSSFTVEFWTYLETTGNRGQFQMSGTAGGFTTAAGGTLGIGSAFGTWYLYANNAFNITGTTDTATTNRWHHIAIVRTDGITKVYQNGTLIISTADTATYNTPHLALGGYYQNAYTHKGYISNFRIVKGLALYTTDFTPTTRPLAPINGTVLLTCQSPELVDTSVYNHTITPSGHAVRSNFSGFSDYPYWSNYFDGSGDYLSIPTTGGSLDATGDFTTELWIYWNSLPTTGYQNIAGQGAAGQNSYGLFSANASVNNWATPHKFKLNVANVGDVLVGNTELVAKQWYHLAHTRSSGVNRLFVNGVLQTNTYTDSTSRGFNGNPYLIGNNSNAYISNFRYVKGTALYTSNFTPNTVPLTAVSGTSLLTCQNQEFVDNSEYNHAITVAGNTITTPTGPYIPSSGYWSNYFDGNGDYLTVPSNAAFAFGSDSFTVECWVYATASGFQAIVGSRTGDSTATIRWSLFVLNTGFLACNIRSTADADIASITHQTPFTLNQWNHCALVRNGTEFRLYYNGVQSTSSTTSSDAVSNSSTAVRVGDFDTSIINDLNGYVSNLRIVKGTALYTANFTPSTTPLTSVSGTSLLTCQDLGFKDNSVYNHVITVTGNTTTKPANPFNYNSLTSPANWSTYFDGNGDFLSLSTADLSPASTTNPFTVESWVYMTAVGGCLFSSGIISQIALSIGFSVSTTGFNDTNANQTGGRYVVFAYYNGSAWIQVVSSTQVTLNQWTHIACVFTGSAAKIYINGVDVTTGTISSWSTFSISTWYLGKRWDNIGVPYFTGYISNFRYIKGTAVYTSDFTPSSSPLLPILGTVLLTCQTANNENLSVENPGVISITANGNAAPVPITPFLIENI